MKQVFIKRYGWVKVLKQDGNYSLIEFHSGSKCCFNTAGFEFRNLEAQQTLDL
jgi:hypothetical protein